MADEIRCDVLVAGSGAAAFAAAITARLSGLDVIMTEKEALFGGTTAYSAGVIWIPANSHARRAGIDDTREAAFAYLEASAGNRLDRARAEAFVSHAAQMLDFFEERTHLAYELAPTWADYEPDLAGASEGGRSLMPLPFDGRRLGTLFPRLRPPLATMMLLGGMMVGRGDLPHLFNMTRSPRSALHVAGMVARYGRDRIRHARGTRLTNGNALLARLALTASEYAIPLWLSAPLTGLVVEGRQVVGARVDRACGPVEVRASRGVVLACGGFPADAAMTRRLYGHVAAGKPHARLPPAGNAGDGIRAAAAAGARFSNDVHHPAAWAPVSLVPQEGGDTLPFPHFFDRGKPGIIAVDRRGRRFVNEAKSYHVFVPAMLDACRGDPEAAAWVVADASALRRFGLGAVPPFPGRIGPFLASGYLVADDTPEALGARLGVDGAVLAATFARFNAHAARGEDPDFGRGGDVYQRFNGAAGHRPNPCIAPLVTPPFYAVRVIPGELGTFAGLACDAEGRVLDRDGQAIPGLWACGNDAASVMGGTYPGAGITIGPGLTFGFIAGRALARGA
jgi:succinate dehydrogenase/fumarate reductase flavoprotein subunit